MIRKINDLLAIGNRGKIESDTEIKKANDYLTSFSAAQVEKPAWLNSFIEGNADTLREIICRSAGEKGFLQTKHYNEGYFNEIIQNANDLHVGNQIDITISQASDVISVKCVYKDSGFKIQDIYGFSKNGMSGKGEEHTGKFGIGIKAFFSFVDNFKITSNVIFEFSNLNDLDKLQQTCCLNSEWDGEHTILEFTFNVRKETTFNIKKLARLAQLLEECEEDSEYLVDLFVSSSYTELLFDVHSLLFTDVQHDSHINKICFNNKLFLQCDTINLQEMNQNVAKVKRKKVSIIYKELPALYERVVTLFYKENMVFGFDHTNNENRLYSTYYLKNVKEQDIKNVGMYIHTPYTNPSRSDLGENEKEINTRINEITEQLADLLLNIAEGQESNAFYNEVASEFFHKCLEKYQNVDISEEEQFNKNNIFYKCVEDKKSNKKLLKLKSTSNLQYYIVNETNTEFYKQEYRPFEKEGTKEKLIKCYKQVIEKNEVLTLQELLNSNHVIPYVRRLYDVLGSSEESENDSNEWVHQMLNYYPNVASFIKYRINPNGDMIAESIANWLDEGVKISDKEMEDYLQKLLGRYKIHPSFTKHGMIKHNELQLVDYLFMKQNVTPGNRFGELLIENYDKQFADLKNVLHRNLTTDVIYYSPYGPSSRKWEGRYRCVTNVKNTFFIEPEFLDRLIDALNTDSAAHNQLWNHFSCIDNHLVLCKSISSKFTVDNKRFIYNETKSTAIIGMNFLKNLKANELTQLFLYQEVADRINLAVDSKNFYYYSEKLVKVEAHFKKITIKQLEQLLTWLLARTKRDLSIPSITIDIIETDNGKNLCEPAKLNILEPLLGADIFQGELGISGENGKHLVVYVKKGVIKYMLGANSGFKELASTLSKTEDDTIYIFGSENLDPTKTLDYVLGDIKDALGNAIGNDTKEVIKSIISIKTIGQTISSKQYEGLNTVYYENKKPRYRSISLNLANYSDFCNNLQIKKRILLARGSYNHQCPRCSKPIDHSEQVGIFIIPQEKHDYKGLACWRCIEILKAGLTKVVYNEQEQYLDLYCKFHLSEYQSQPKITRIYVSPINKQLF